MFLVLTTNEESEVKVDVNNGQPHRGGFTANAADQNGHPVNGIAVAPLGGAITPKMPLLLKLTPQNGKSVDFRGIFHQVSHNEWHPVPAKN